MKKYGVSRHTFPYIVKVLNRDQIAFSYIETEKGYDFFLPDETTQKAFRIMLEDADCERQRSKTMHHAPVYSLRTIRNKQKLDRLCALNNRNSFQVWEKDKEEFNRMSMV